jgi:hypothetical protein
VVALPAGDWVSDTLYEEFAVYSFIAMLENNKIFKQLVEFKNEIITIMKASNIEAFIFFRNMR